MIGRDSPSDPDSAAAPAEACCPEPSRWLGLLDGTTGPADAEWLEGHLAGCAACREQLRHLTSLGDEAAGWLARSGTAEAEDSATEPFLARLQADYQRLERHDLVRHAVALTGAAAQGGRIGPYRIERCAGTGGMSVVYEATDTRLNRPVALKMLLLERLATPIHRERLEREAAVLAQLGHPHIVPVHEVGEHVGQPYLVLEYVGGGTLAHWAAGRTIAPAEAAQAVQTLASALQFAHERGVIHRDLKPGNILLQPIAAPAPAGSESGSEAGPRPLSAYRLMISDFGLARWRAGDDAMLTRTGQPLGTPAYMAPEQARGQHDAVGPATDLYALGAILYELLTGRPPFQASSVVETLQLIQQAEPLSPRWLQPVVSRDLETITLRCLEKGPSRRYATAAALADDLTRYLERRPILARPVRWPGRVLRWGRRHPDLAVMAALVLVLLVTLAVGGVSSAWVQAGLRQRAEQRETEARAEKERAMGHLRTAIQSLDQVAASLNFLNSPPGTQVRAVRDSSYVTELRWCTEYLAQTHGPETWTLADLHVAVIQVKLLTFLGRATSAEAEAIARQAQQAALRLERQSPAALHASQLYEAAHFNQAQVHLAAGRPADALASFRQIDRLLTTPGQRAKPDEVLGARFSVQGEIAALHERLGDLDQALTVTRASLEPLRQLQARHPAVLRYLTMHLQQVERLVGLLLRQGQPEAAFAELTEALARIKATRMDAPATDAGFAEVRRTIPDRWVELAASQTPAAQARAVERLQTLSRPDRPPIEPELAARFLERNQPALALELTERAVARPARETAAALDQVALCCGLATDSRIDPAQRPVCLDRALTLLDAFRAAGTLAGPEARQALTTRPAFAPLQSRPEFERLLQALAAPTP